MSEAKKIIIDEDWKDEAQREKEALAQAAEAEKAQRERPPEPASFMMLVSSLASQALMGMGDIPNPFTGQRELDLESSQLYIDLLDVLDKKTKGNLTPDEQKTMEGLLYDLRMRFVQIQTHLAKQPPPA